MMSAVPEYTLPQRFALGIARTLTDWAESSAAVRRAHRSARAEAARRRALIAPTADQRHTLRAEQLSAESRRQQALRERDLGPRQY